jgi:hypothetical protein
VLNIPAFLAKRANIKKRTRDLHEADVAAVPPPKQLSACRYSLAQGIHRIVASQSELSQ